MPTIWTELYKNGTAKFVKPETGGLMHSTHWKLDRKNTACFALAFVGLIFCAGSARAWNYLTPLTNQVVCPGQNVTFSTTASGPTPYKFEWWKNGSVIPGKTNTSLTLSNVSIADTATYSVKLTGGYNMVTNSATLSVRTNVGVSPMPNLIRSISASAVFSPVVAGTAPFTYVWSKDGTNLAGQTLSTLTLSNLAISDSGTYSITVFGSCGSTATASAILRVDSCFPALDVMLVIDRSGSMTGQPYSDARQACSNFVQNLHFTTNGDYAGLASYNSSATLDQKLTNSLSVLDQAIHSIPAAGGNTSISLGLQTAQAELISVRHHSNSLPVMVLLSDGLPTGSDTPSNALYVATQAKDAGTRIFTVGLGAVDPNLMMGIASSPSDYFHTTNSSDLSGLFNAISTVICRPPTNIATVGPSNQTVCAGLNASFSVSASGCDAFSYQWEKNGVRLPGRTNTSLVITNASAADAGVYSVEIINMCRTVTNSATLTVNQPVIVSDPPDSVTNCTHTTAVFNVGASGTGLVYQWYFGSSPLSGRTGTSLVLTDVSPNDSGAYSVVVGGACGPVVSNSATLTVFPAPTIACVPNKIAQIGSGWDFDTPTANYPLTIVSTVTNTANHCGNTFDATRTWRSQDPCGNAVTCSQTVMVMDNTPPMMNCASSTNKTVQLGTAWIFDAPTATDNSGTVTITILSTITNSANHCGNTFDATRVWQAMDGCSNSATCSQTITVIDTTAPVMDCTSSTNKTVQLGTAWTFDPPTATDNSGSVTISILSTTTNTANHCGNTFDATRVWQAMDGCSNSATCSQTVTVIDTTAPVMDCTSSTNKTVQLGTAWTFDAPTATDNGGSVTITVLSTITNSANHCGNTFDATRVWQAMDGCSNSATCSQTVTVIDTTAPVMDCTSSTNKTVQLGTAWTFDAPTATDNSGSVTITILSTTTNTANHCGNTFEATRVWQAMDGCSNAATCSQTVTVIDTTAPVMDCTSSTNKIVQVGTAWAFDAPTATDNSGSVTITVLSTITNTANHCGNTFDATRVWQAMDGCSNSATCSQTVTVIDTTPPVMDCSSSSNKNATLGAPWNFDPPTATDNSGSVTMVVLSTVTNTTSHCGGGFDATRVWLAMDACSNSASCSQTVTVIDNQALSITSLTLNHTNCPGSLADLSVSARGTGLMFAWLRNGTLLGTNGLLELTNISAADVGTYQIVVSDPCGDAITNSVSLSLYSSTTAGSLTSETNNLGDTVTLTTTASGTGPFTYVWSKDGTNIAGATTNTLTLANVSYASAGTYSVQISGYCGSIVRTATLAINHPPTATIVSPTNGTSFIAPATFTVAATAQDVDGVVTNLEFFQFGSKIGQTTNSNPGLVFVTNLPAGSYTYTAAATDNLGARGTSAPVTINVLSAPPLSVVSAMRLNPQTGLFEQTVRVWNPTYYSFGAVRILIFGLTSGTTVYNGSGITNGIPYVQSYTAIPSGSYSDFVIEYYVPSRVAPNPTLIAQLVTPVQGGNTAVSGLPQHIERAIWLRNSSTFLIEFTTITNRIYYVEYSGDLKTWKSALPPVTGNGTRIQWIDNGQPKTESAPAVTAARFFRVVLLP